MRRKLLSIFGVLLCLSTLPVASCGPAATPSTAALRPTETPMPTATSTPGVTVTVAAPATTAPMATATATAALTSTNTPELVATAVPQEPAATGTAAPVVRFFRVTPTTTLNLGDELTMTWEASGDRVELCPISGPGPVEGRCQDVPLTGSTRFVTDEEALSYTGFGLRVTAGGSSIWSLVDVRLQCQNLRPWFFADAPQRCPADLVRASYAAGQYFERGLMIWVENPDDFYVFYRGQDELGFQVFDWISDIQLRPGASPDHRVGEQPPAGLYEPVSGFGMVWRGEIEGVRADVRERLGWATGPESGFDTAYQCETTFYPGLWSCFLRGPRGEILRLRPDSTAQVRWLWEEWEPSP